jgi:hypothetical protein
MTKDIFDTWKKNKFIQVDFELLDRPDILIVLTDFAFWANHQDELDEWCRKNGGTVTGMTVEFEAAEQLTLFTLRWL